MKAYIKYFTIILGVALIFFGCKDRSDLTPPAAPSTGNADFTRFVSIGNSLTMGEQSGAVFETGQMYSFGNLIADQVHTTYAQPLFSDPGTGGRLEVASLEPFEIKTNNQTGMPLNLTYQAPYNNLGVKGAFLFDVMNATDSNSCYTAQFGAPNPLFNFVLRGQGNMLQQAMAQNPTFVTLWIGNNDILAYATRGGLFPITSGPNFQTMYTVILDSLAKTNADVIIANIPDVTNIPFFRTVGPVVAGKIPWGLLGGTGLFYQKMGETVASSFADSTDLVSGNVFILLTGNTFAGYIGQPSGFYYRATGNPIPAGIDTTKPFGLHPQNPWPNGLILDNDEINNVNQAITGYNGIIANLANAHNYQVVDINGLLNQLAVNGYHKFGLDLSMIFVQGGIISLDGVHPTSRGYAIIANAFIDKINEVFSATIPEINVATIPGSIILDSQSTGKIASFKSNADIFSRILF